MIYSWYCPADTILALKITEKTEFSEVGDTILALAVIRMCCVK